ncbi:MAG: hypothetical protein ACTSR3_08555 [Candidatus Helarchaeota archaeon]
MVPKLAWCLSAHYGFHGGDSLHLSTVLLFQIERFGIIESDFVERINTSKQDILKRNGEYEDLYSIFPDYTKIYVPTKINRALEHLNDLKIISKDGIK